MLFHSRGSFLATLTTLILVGFGSSLSAQKSDKYPTNWTYHGNALEVAKKRRWGILYYFPPKGSNEEHPLFNSKEMNELSNRSVVVKVDEKCGIKDELRKEYSVPDKFMHFVLADYYGNKIADFTLKRGSRQKVDVDRHFTKTLKQTDKFVRARSAEVKKLLEKGQSAFERQKYAAAAKEFQKFADLKGFPEAKKAREKLQEIIDIGKLKIETAQRGDPNDLKGELKKIGREFKDTAIEVEVDKLLEELDKKK